MFYNNRKATTCLGIFCKQESYCNSELTFLLIRQFLELSCMRIKITTTLSCLSISIQNHRSSLSGYILQDLLHHSILFFFFFFEKLQTCNFIYYTWEFPAHSIVNNTNGIFFFLLMTQSEVLFSFRSYICFLSEMNYN